MALGGGLEPLFHDHRVGLSSHRREQYLGEHLCRGVQIRIPYPVLRPYLLFVRFEQASLFTYQDFIDMGGPHKSPSGFFVKGLEEFLIGDKPPGIRDQTEFVGSVPQDIDQQPAQVFGLDVFSLFSQNTPPTG